MWQDREQAGKLLVAKLVEMKARDGVVYAIPRGGVVVASAVAEALRSPMDLIITRKIGHPYSPEYALCVVAEDGERWCNESEVTEVSEEWLETETQKEMAEAKRRREIYWGNKARPVVAGKTAYLVDDGIATGMTFLAAVKELKHLAPKKIVAVLPVMPSEFEAKIRSEVDEVVCLLVDQNYLGAVGAYYADFPQVSDEEVVVLLKEGK